MRAFWRLAVVQTPMVGCPVAGQRGDRHLDRDRVHVQVVGGVDAVHCFQGAERRVQVLERPQVTQVEDRAQVDVEGIGPLAREHGCPAAQVVDRGAGQAGVVRRRQRPDVARRAGQVAAQRHGAPAGGHGHVVGLDPVPVRVGQRADRARVVQEDAGVADRGAEPEPVGDVGPAVPIVVDVDLVLHVVAELEEVRARRGKLQRDVVGDQRDGVTRADECVQVSAVGYRVLGDLRRLAVR